MQRYSKDEDIVNIRKVVIPAAGFGTRFLPITKVIPKEMLPLINKPAIQYIIEEGIQSNINQFIIILGRSKEVIANYFDRLPELESLLKEKGKENLIKTIEQIVATAHFTYIRQAIPLGLGHAVKQAEHAIGKDYFGVMLPDDIFIGDEPVLTQLAQIAQKKKASVIAVQEVDARNVSSYGIVGISKKISSSLFQVSHLVEKPSIEMAPSNLAIIGRYILSPSIFTALEKVTIDNQGELQLTNGIAHMIKNGETVLAYKVDSTRHDIGTPLGWLKATYDIALHDPLYASQLKEYLVHRDKSNT